MSLNPCIIDCDTGRDDAMAIWLSLALGDKLCGVVSSFGNAPLDKVLDNNLRVLSLANRADISTYIGSKEPPIKHKGYKDKVLSRHALCGNGLNDVSLPEPVPLNKPLPMQELAKDLVELKKKYGRIDYIITGPATNFARMYKDHREILENCIDKVFMMGGKFSPLWEETPGADFNFISDPYAVQQILSAPFDFYLVPMNLTWNIFSSKKEIEAFSAGNTVAKYIKMIMTAYCEMEKKPFRYHDPCTVLLRHDLTKFSPLTCTLVSDEDSPFFGRLVETSIGRKVFVANYSEIQPELIRAEILHALRIAHVQTQ